MNKNTKLVARILAGLLVLCICTCSGGWGALKIAGRMIQNAVIIDAPEEAALATRNMIDYELPAGYKEEGVINMGFVKMAFINDTTSDSEEETARPVFMIAAMPSDMPIDEEEIRLQIQLSVKKSARNHDYDLKLVDEQQTTIRGQEVSLLIYEGTDSTGTPMRQVVSGVFKGKTDMIMLLIIGVQSNWDQNEIDTFIKSIK